VQNVFPKYVHLHVTNIVHYAVTFSLRTRKLMSPLLIMTPGLLDYSSSEVHFWMTKLPHH